MCASYCVPYTLIKGKYHVTGYSPDGDTIRFQPDNVQQLDNILGPNRRLQINDKQHVSLRFDGVDTLETHYSGEHQPELLGNQATDFVLNSLGINNVVWNTNHSKISSSDDGITGYILTRSKDLFGRIISFVFSGVPVENDGDDVFLNSNRLRQSINYKLLENGLAYPAFYKGLFPDLRETMTTAAKKSRIDNSGIWAVDSTHSVTVSGTSSITDTSVIFPKLFRRMISYLKSNSSSVDGFVSYLEQRNDELLLLYSRQTIFFDTLIRVDNNHLSMGVLPESIIFLPRS